MEQTWRKSGYSDANGGSCVETGAASGKILVRDTTNRDGGTLALSASAWQAFMNEIKSVLPSGLPRTAGQPVRRGRER
jgi:hypothetical protein